MKIWLKYLIGIAIGLISFIAIPVKNTATLDYFVELTVHVGRYILLPVLFFSLTCAFFKLRDEKQLLKASAWTFGTIAVSTLGLTLFGLITALMIKLPRIPITTEKLEEASVLTWKTIVLKLFPTSGFDVLHDGAYLLPCFVFAGLAGAGCVSDKNASKPALTVFISMSKVFYSVLSFLTEILAIGMVAIMFRWTLTFSSVIKTGVFNKLILMLTIDLLIIAFVFYPLILRFLCHEHHPYRVLYASICPFLVAFFSGDTNLTLTLSLRHGKESLGIKRRINAFSYTLFSIFGRGGAALVQCIGFVLIITSYSSLGISNAMWIGTISFVFSFLLGGLPCGGPFAAITSMCIVYGAEYESGYLLLKSVSPIICAYAAAIDALTAMFGSYIVAVKTKNIQHQEVKKFI